ncbi:dihydrolipoyl dehydrogenase family protein [Mongoliimonas terrestris]|uniref:dihydrolipoyl dehydrogenase family protein n=1 Tax=Mongoliimonas terrestris TaxID=1709001 RepID=UPI0009498E19|nr:FAD-dependent oxidoreductase [Mongoliimonas terrestris]
MSTVALSQGAGSVAIDAAAVLEPDLCVIGAGSAGLSLTAAARALDLSVVLVERHRMGGDCLNTGCVPSKALIAAARHAHAIRTAAAFGVTAGAPEVDAAAVRAHVRSVIDGIAPHDSVARFERLGATVISAEARFTGPDTLVAGGRTVKAKRFVVATGSRPQLPPVPGLDQVPVLTNESVFDLDALPRRLVVIGGGPIGLELAQAFRRLGAAVTVLTRGEILSRDDREAVAVVRARLLAEGVDIVEHAVVDRVATVPDGATVTVTVGGATRQVAASHILVAAGRAPVTDGLGLEDAGVETTPKGITVTPALRTTNWRIYAIGDVAGSFQFTHWASHQAGQVLRTILTRLPQKEATGSVIWATYTDPEIAHVGLSEAEARRRHRTVRVLRAPYLENDRARTDRDTEGFVKIITGAGGRILGAELVGPGAGETASLFALALAGRLKVSHLAGMIAPYPTLAEVAKRAAVTSYADTAKHPFVRRVIRLLRATL